MEAIGIIFFFIFGLLIGSFINVLILRFGFKETPRHRSACQACQSSLAWYELFPVLSYVLLRGKCRACGSRIALQYPAVELSTGVLFAFSFSVAFPIITFGGVVSFIALLIFWASFVALVIYDLRHTLVPTIFVFPLLGAALLLRVGEILFLGSITPIYDAFLGAALLGGIIGVLVLVTRGRGMGVGDIYIALALGLMFGVARGIEVLTMAFWIGAVVGLTLITVGALRRHIRLSSLRLAHQAQTDQKQFRMKSEVPFIPFLFAAALIGAYTWFSPFMWIGTFTNLLLP
ncbi:MAG: prepilin peptidase [Patescibacteria group bacterium UBA2163]